MVKIMTFTTLTGSLILLPISLVSGGVFFATSIQGWLVLFGLAIICQIMGQGMIVLGLEKLPASFAGVTLLIQPVGVCILGMLILHQMLSSLQIVGGIIVIAGIFIANRGRK